MEPDKTTAIMDSTTPSQATRDARLDRWLLMLGIVAATALFYLPALHGKFIWDDDIHISSNWTLQSLKGLHAIWFIPAASCQYYPLTFTVFWSEYHLWGLDTTGYHVVNILLHATIAILLWQIMDRLKLRGGLLAGAIFALHPVNVMSVAWMTELKNTLSGTLALLAVWAYIRFAKLGVYADSREKSRPAWGWYVLALALFQCAMFAKTAVSFLPLSLFLIVWWQKERLGWKDILSLVPMLGIALGMGAFTIYIEHHSGGAIGADFRLSFMERLLVSGRSFWFYLGKLFFPVKLSFIYGRWNVDPGNALQYFYPLAMAGLLAGLWLARKRIGKGLFAAMMHFYISTSMLVLMVVLFMMRYTFVSDHWQYFGAIGVIALMGEGLMLGLLRFGWWGKPIGTRIVLGLLLLLGVLTWMQCGMYVDNETLWRKTVAKCPDSWMAHDNLGNALSLLERPDEAIPEHVEALRLKPDSAEAYGDLGVALEKSGQVQDAIASYKKSLELNPRDLSSHFNLGNLLLFKTDHLDEAIEHLEKAIQLESEAGLWPGNVYANYDLGVAFTRKREDAKAVTNYEKVLEFMPGLTPAKINLAWLLATSRDGAVRNGTKALELAEQVNKMTEGVDPNALKTLAAAYAAIGQFKVAADTAQKALGIAISRSQTDLVEALEDQIQAYQSGQPYTEGSSPQ